MPLGCSLARLPASCCMLVHSTSNWRWVGLLQRPGHPHTSAHAQVTTNHHRPLSLAPCPSVSAPPHQTQRLLLELQSAVQLCPAAVPQLLEAMQPQHRQRQASTLLHLQEHHLQHHQQQQQQPHIERGVRLAQQLQELSVVDVLLAVSLSSQQQWAADVSLALMQGVLAAGRWVALRSNEGTRQLL